MKLRRLTFALGMLSHVGAAVAKVGHRQTPYKVKAPPGIPGEGFLLCKNLILILQYIAY